jgi:Ca-activated chloride channel family protein
MNPLLKFTIMKNLIWLLLPFTIAWGFTLKQTYDVTGIVKDERGKPIAYVSVNIKNARTGVSTNTDGSYTIKVPDQNTVLVFACVGYEKIEINISGHSIVDVVMKPSSAALSEVVVTSAYQTKRSARTYASPKMESKMISGNGNYQNDEAFNTESYDYIKENGFLKVLNNPLSTFSIDVDAASYSNIRRMLNEGNLPPAGAVRIEEMINYFSYDYPQPTGEAPFSFTTEMSSSPWNPNHKLVMIGMQGKKISVTNLPASNLVFLIDVSGSMQSANKLPLVKASLKLLIDQLREQDKVSIVVYAGAAGLVLPPTSGANKQAMKDALEKLSAGGSTAGGEGIELAYKTARANFSKNGNNRVILCSDGDFNIGSSSDDEMERLIEKERTSGVFLTVLGYGMGNYKDSKMQKLADKGNGNHAYIDGIAEAKKVLIEEFGGTLFTIAKDVKLQIEFNPSKVQAYRLVGYENRLLANEDFNDDKKDAGDLGSGHTVTAMYEIIPVGVKSNFIKDVDALKYQTNPRITGKYNGGNETMTIKFRYKAPDGEVSQLITHTVNDKMTALDRTTANFRFATAVAEFGMLLRNSEFKGNASYPNILAMGKSTLGVDKEGYRAEFLQLVQKSQQLMAAHKNKNEIELSR